MDRKSFPPLGCAILKKTFFSLWLSRGLASDDIDEPQAAVRPVTPVAAIGRSPLDRGRAENHLWILRQDFGFPGLDVHCHHLPSAIAVCGATGRMLTPSRHG